VLREIGVETGGSNVQFAVEPETGRLMIIEMNPRVSRSSALASKATGFPIAKVAARLAVGYTLDEIANDITGGATPASFEPTIDYVVTKIPRFAFEKFPGAEPYLTTSMKSVGEVMAIGRTFQESLQKALRGLETGLTGLNETAIPGAGEGDDRNAIRAALERRLPTAFSGSPRPSALALRSSRFSSRANTSLVPAQIEELVRMEETIRERGLPSDAAKSAQAKSMGFSDKRLAELVKTTRTRSAAIATNLASARYSSASTPVPASSLATAYVYSTYEEGDEAYPSDRQKVIILGGGPNRIGQGIEFDYCCCHAATRCMTPASNRSWSTAIRKPSRPITTPPIASISSRSRRRMCWRLSIPSNRRAR
jgi:carbamoyl-phosphate synthase large subunit